MRVTVRRPGQSAQPVIRVQKRPDDGFVKRSAKRPSKRSQATAVESAVPCGAPTGDAEDIVSKSAPPWIGLEQPFQRGRLPLRYFVVNAPSAARRQRSETAKVHPGKTRKTPEERVRGDAGHDKARRGVRDGLSGGGRSLEDGQAVTAAVGCSPGCGGCR